MAKLLFSNKAVEDLTNIWNYTVETWSEVQADKYYTLLVGGCQQIAGSPRPLGREYVGNSRFATTKIMQTPRTAKYP